MTTAGLTAWRALVSDGPLKAGETILTLGTGGVSMCVLQFAKMMGALTIVTSSSDEKLARARSLGADYTINYKQYPNWADQVLNRTDGHGVDHVIEVGGPDTLPQSIRALDANDMKPVIDKTFPLQDLIEAFRYEASGAHFGKICIEV